MEEGEFNNQIEISSDIFDVAYQTIGSVIDRHMSIFGSVGERTEEDALPPALVSASHRDARLDFETTLGHYDADSREVVIWQKGVDYAAKSIGRSSVSVVRVVKYHEWAHALHHVGLKPDADLTSRAAAALGHQDLRFRNTPDDLKEQIAQLTAVVAIRRRKIKARFSASRDALDDILETFFLLMKQQSRKYIQPADVRTCDVDYLERKLRLLLDMADSGIYPAVEHIKEILSPK